jgi:hypothetical protein
MWVDEHLVREVEIKVDDTVSVRNKAVKLIEEGWGVSESVEMCVVNSTACSYSMRPTKIVTWAPVALILASTYYLITRSQNSLTTPHHAQ